MIEFVVDEKRKKEIYVFESKMFAKYKEAIVPYSLMFREKGCELRLELGWYNPIRKIWSANRIPLQNGYGCYIYCLVEKGGEEVCIKSKYNEVDYYPLETEWMISSVNRRFHKLKISLYEDLDDVDADMKGLLSQLWHME